MHYLTFDEKALYITRSADKHNNLEITYRDYSVREHRTALKKYGMPFTCLIGIKYVQEIPMLLLGIDVNEVFTIEASKIYQIKKIGFVAVAPESSQQSILKNIAQELSELQSIFQLGFHYYSQQYDPSVPFLLNRIQTPSQLERRYYDQFVWNYNLAHFEGQKSERQTQLFWNWCDKIIQGYACEYTCQLPQEKIRYLIISRRSYKKAGTRFYARGIDDKGNVANFTETEQIIFLGGYVFSHLQIRGSVPAFFAQVGINGIAHETVIERSLEMTKNAFQRHFMTLRQMYSRIFAVNLLSQKKSDQKSLSTFYESLIDSQPSTMSYLKYKFYDFHEQCKNNKFENSQALIATLHDIIEAMGYNCYQVKTNKLLIKQKGVFRTNCLDCLDRTNYIQSRIALRAVKLFLQKFGPEGVHTLSKDKKLLDMPVNEEFPLLRGFNELWADNGDAISLLYTGIGSTHTDITRTGERTLIGAINHKFKSLMRFAMQFSDHVKHEAINKLVTPSILRSSLPFVSDFHTTLLLSYDNDEPVEDALQTLRTYLLKSKATIVVIFVFQRKQQTFWDKLTCMINNKSDFTVWQKALCDQTEEQDYTKVCSLMTEQSWMGAFCLKNVTKEVADVKTQNLSKHITSGQALLIKMKLHNSSFIFAGVNIRNFNDYLLVFDELHEKAFQISKLGQFKSSSFFDLDYKVVIGNTGSSNLLSQKDFKELSQQFQEHCKSSHQKEANQALGKILDHDQFTMEEKKNKSKYLKQYNEGPVNFVPSSNRMVFWNHENIVLRVRQYQQTGKNCIVSVLDYEIGLSSRSSLLYHE